MTLPVPVDAHLCRKPHPAGLGGLVALVEGVETAFPLTLVRVRTTIVGDCARTSVTQVFTNPHRTPLEAVHLFPLPEDGAVVALTLTAGETVVQAVCKERQQAEQDFAEARTMGHRAALLTQERDDVHTLAVTRIPPGEEVRVELEVVERLEKVDGTYRWRFPTVVAPRYLTGTPIGHDGPGVLPATDQVPDADRLQPPLRLEGGTELDLEVAVQGPVRGLACAQHAVSMELGDTLRIAPTGATLDRDFVLAFSTAAADEVVSRAWTDGTYTLLTVEPPAEALPTVLPRDAVFVVDISGSMGGVKMTAAKRALQAAVRGLGAGDRFRIIAFDDRVEAMSPELLPFDAAGLERADAFIEGLGARGGTHMLPAIVEALAGDRPEGRSRSVLFVTDGQAHDEAALIAAIANRRQGARFFTLGIDTAVNGALLKRMARVGGGTCELVTPRDDIEEALANLEARFGNPVLDGVEVDGLQAARLTKQAVFTGRPATLLLEGAPSTLTVRGVGPTGPVAYPVQTTSTTFGLGALWARERIAALQDRLLVKPFEEEALRPEIVRIALEHGIASRFTSFVAVDRERQVLGPLREQVQPAEKPADWAMFGGAPGRATTGARAPRGARRVRKQKAEAPAKKGALGMLRDLVSGGGARQDAEEAAYDVMGALDDDFDGVVSDAAPQPPPPAKPVAAPAPLGVAKSMAAPSRAAQPVAPNAHNPASELARTQEADGSYGGDVERTAAALLALLLLGHTRRTGSRRRTVAKAARWLSDHDAPLAKLALAALAAAEAGKATTPTDAWAPLHAAGPEGTLLARVSAR